MNSILDNITKEDIIAEIQLLLNSDVAHKKVVVVVEGLDDIRFISGMCFNNENVLVIQSYSGKLGAIDIIQNYINEQRVIAILDKDYCTCTEENKIFYYDYCCLEMMLISSVENFNNIFKEYIYPDRLSSEEFKEYLLKQLKCISLLRKINEEKNLGIEFYRISINDLYKNNKIDIKEFKKQINERNNNYLKEHKEIEQQLDNEYNQEMDKTQLLEITNGHDFCEMLAIVSRLHNRKGISRNIIESMLRCSYRESDFYRTKLFQDLKEYGDENKIIILN